MGVASRVAGWPWRVGLRDRSSSGPTATRRPQIVRNSSIFWASVRAGTPMRKLLIPTLLLAACGGDADLATPDQCNPFGGSRCITPWPSALYETDDAASETGRRLAVPAGALPTNIDGIPLDPAISNKWDGFSSAAPPVIAFDTGIDPTEPGPLR